MWIAPLAIALLYLSVWGLWGLRAATVALLIATVAAVIVLGIVWWIDQGRNTGA